MRAILCLAVLGVVGSACPGMDKGIQVDLLAPSLAFDNFVDGDSFLEGSLDELCARVDDDRSAASEMSAHWRVDPEAMDLTVTPRDDKTVCVPASSLLVQDELSTDYTIYLTVTDYSGNFDSIDAVITIHSDVDKDGYGADDCDDADSEVHPGAIELCDGIDNDCDGDIDEEDDDLADGTLYFEDRDLDGYGTDERSTTLCQREDGWVTIDGDCDDHNDTVYPGAYEIEADNRDEDCDGLEACYSDADEDLYTSGLVLSADLSCTASGLAADESAEEDCDDLSEEVHPLADEICNEIDDNCDGVIDEDEATGAPTWYSDADADGFGDPATAAPACDAPSGAVDDATDCDDGDASVHPGADEHCDGADDNCDGTVDESTAIDALLWFSDADADGYGDPASPVAGCSQPSGAVANDEDCDDANASTNPTANEYCDGEDDNCDGTVDEDSAIDAPTWYADVDLDGYGDAASSSVSCSAPSGAVSTASDCDDMNGDVHPGADERCDGVDDDCDGSTDEDSAVDASTWYLDDDGDGFGDATTGSPACTQPSGAVADDTDCDDTDDEVYPGADEALDGVDQSCDGATELLIAHPTAGDEFGRALASAGDTNGGSATDLVIGSYDYSPSGSHVRYGAAWLFLGAVATDLSSADAWATLTGSATDSRAGIAVSGAGDLDGDGFDDFLVGEDAYTGTHAGRAYLVWGPVGSGSAALTSYPYLTGQTAGDQAGVRLAGSTEGDQILVSAVEATAGGLTAAGKVYLVAAADLPSSGSAGLESVATAIISGTSANANIGTSVLLADIDGDGVEDVVLNSDRDGGTVWFFQGPLSGSLDTTDADGSLTAVGSSDQLGSALAVGDPNDDGVPDVLIGARYADDGGTNSGAAYLVEGTLKVDKVVSAKAWATIPGLAASDFAGHAVAMADLDADGIDDLAVGAYGVGISTTAGAAYVIFGDGGLTGSLSADRSLQGTVSTGQAGASLASLPDQDGDGGAELLVGEPGADDVWLLFGGDL